MCALALAITLVHASSLLLLQGFLGIEETTTLHQVYLIRTNQTFFFQEVIFSVFFEFFEIFFDCNYCDAFSVGGKVT